MKDVKDVRVKVKEDFFPGALNVPANPLATPGKPIASSPLMKPASGHLSGQPQIMLANNLIGMNPMVFDRRQ
jgi:hypothetical protein